MKKLLSTIAAAGMAAILSVPTHVAAPVVLSVPAMAVLSLHDVAEARGGKRANGQVRSGGKHSVNRNVNRNTNVNRNVNRNTNVNVNRSRHVDVDVHHRYGYGVGVGVAAAATAIAIGTIVATLPPNCTTIIVGNVSYRECGGVWYAPRYSGSTVNYVVINDPR